MSELTLDGARDWLRNQVDDGAHCPCCGQYAKVYRRKINAGMAWSLATMYRKAGRDWIHLPTQIGARSREEGKLAYWNLVEQHPSPRNDGGKAGWWRVTRRGELFVLDQIRLPKYARVYNGRCLSLDGTETVGIRDCLGTRFHYDDLMAGL